MVFHMRTTLTISDSLMQRLRQEAARRGTTMSQLVEAGLRRVLSEPEHSDPPPTELRQLPTWSGGKELVDISNRDLLYNVMEEE
ncbi:MAG: ribbon-helix-helix protein, CopG family [Acidobacteriia bacterium]|nr:ribbon-helix-helix protein, CopG family [Terriglobia bacterium]